MILEYVNSELHGTDQVERNPDELLSELLKQANGTVLIVVSPYDCTVLETRTPSYICRTFKFDSQLGAAVFLSRYRTARRAMVSFCEPPQPRSSL